MSDTTGARYVLHFAPYSRALRALWLLQESGLPYELVVHDLARATHKAPEYLAVNPDGKVPALVDRGPGAGAGWPVVVTESSAVCAYIAEQAEATSRLAPALGSPARAAYLVWMAYGPAALEPSLADSVWGRAKDAPASAIGWPPFEATMARLEQALHDRDDAAPWLLGAEFSAADVMIGGMIVWLAAWGKLPPAPALQRYLAAVTARPAFVRAKAIEAEHFARQKAAREGSG